ncbi:hypothetical protein VTL71DRAFT_1199 [Oculimacula yallundae]|uniref:Transmembrane protein n=1 Tax=Oculimacula yallundae TaxID=86028 RepID=A0ABR4D267_9HELO
MRSEVFVWHSAAEGIGICDNRPFCSVALVRVRVRVRLSDCQSARLFLFVFLFLSGLLIWSCCRRRRRFVVWEKTEVGDDELT